MSMASLISAGGSIAGNLAGGLITNSQNRRNAQIQMDYQTNMSNTAHQREMADLKAAGLNPLLTATGGAGASTSQGAMATMENVLSPGITSAIDASRLKKEIDAVDSQISLQQTQKLATEAQALKDTTSAKNTAAQTSLLETQMPMYQSEAKAKKKQFDWDSSAADYDAITKRIQSGLNSIPNVKQLIPNKGIPKTKLPKDQFKKYLGY